MRKYIALKDNLEQIFLSKKVRLKKRKLIKSGNTLVIEHYNGFITIHVENIITIFYFFNGTAEIPHNDFIDVTLNQKYYLKNILRGSLKVTNAVIEGADGVGKSTVVRNLANNGYLTQDRAVKEITQKMREEIPNQIRINEVEKYLQSNPNRKVIFLYISDEEVLRERIYSREVITEYDKKALISQRLYVDTFAYLKRYKNLFLVDCLNKTEVVLAEEIEKLM